MTRVRLLRLLGTSLLLVFLGMPLETGCFCATGPSGPPPQETCDPSGMTFDGVTALSITSVEPVFGAQGGMHTEIRFSALGTTLPSCAEYTLYVDDAAISSGTIRGAVSGGSFASRPIIFFGPGGLGLPSGALTVGAFGLRSLPFGAPADAGAGDTGGADGG